MGRPHGPIPGPASTGRPGQAVAVKRNVAGLVTEDQPAHRSQGWILAVPLQEPVVDSAHNLRQQEHRQLKANAKPLPRQAKCGETPMAADTLSAESRNRRPE